MRKIHPLHFLLFNVLYDGKLVLLQNLLKMTFPLLILFRAEVERCESCGSLPQMDKPATKDGIK